MFMIRNANGVIEYAQKKLGEPQPRWMKILARGTYTGTGKDMTLPIPPGAAHVFIRPYDKRENRHDRKRSMKMARYQDASEADAFNAEIERIEEYQAWKEGVLRKMSDDPSFDFMEALRERYPETFMGPITANICLIEALRIKARMEIPSL